MDTDVVSLRDHVQIVRRRWRIPALSTALGILAALGLSALQDPLYQAEAVVLLEPSQTSNTATVMDPDEVATQARVVASAQVADRVVQALDLDTEPDALLRSVSVEVLEQTRTVGITAQRPTAEEAAAVADAFAEGYLEFRAEAAAQTASSVRDALISQLGAVRGQLSLVREELANLGDRPRRRQILEAQEQGLVTREAELRTEISLTQVVDSATRGGGQVLREAGVPGTPVQPRPVRAAGFGALIGLVVGLLLAYVRDRFDDGIREEHQLQSAAGGRPVLGRIPQEVGDRSRLATLLAPSSPASEAYRTLTANIRFLGAAHEHRARGELLMVSSAVASEGKTTLAANVAVTAARVGLRVLLVDADLRHPDAVGRFGVSMPLGLSHVLAGQAGLDEVVYDADGLGVPGLSLMAAGVVPPNAAELLAGPRAAALWDELRSQADLVVVDTPPVLRVADTLEIAGRADLVILVARHGVSRAHEVGAAVERIRQVGGSVAGVAWCGIPDRQAAYGYGTPVPV
jgi:capsular exopolysaccharide synthesis family protein